MFCVCLNHLLFTIKGIKRKNRLHFDIKSIQKTGQSGIIFGKPSESCCNKFTLIKTNMLENHLSGSFEAAHWKNSNITWISFIEIVFLQSMHRLFIYASK